MSSSADYTRTAWNFLLASLLCALFGLVYEFFSHGVYSLYMIYAFLLPLAGGCFPCLALARSRKNLRLSETGQKFWNNGIAWLCVGCLVEGILEIYGTTNQLVWIYLAVGGLLLILGLVFQIFFRISHTRSQG